MPLAKKIAYRHVVYICVYTDVRMRDVEDATHVDMEFKTCMPTWLHMRGYHKHLDVVGAE